VACWQPGGTPQFPSACRVSCSFAARSDAQARLLRRRHLDGFIAGPGGGDPSRESYFPLHEDLVEFIVAEYPETLPGAARQAMGLTSPGSRFDTVLEGRASYEVGLAAGITKALKQHSSVIGSGIPMFNGPFRPHTFRPTESRELDSGVRILTFDRR
jgi:hypothetical protein